MEYPVKYFGYGANASADMIEAIIGRRPDGVDAVLEGYQLAVQSWKEIPANVQGILRNNWGENFTTYTIKEGTGKVSGKIWFLTAYERELIRNWEIVDLWYEQVNVLVNINGDRKKAILIDTERLGKGQKAEHIVDGPNYPVFLNRKEDMLRVARRVSEEYRKLYPERTRVKAK